LTRSRLIALALEDFLRRNENKQMLESLNTVYGKQEHKGEKAGREAMRHLQRALVEGEW